MRFFNTDDIAVYQGIAEQAARSRIDAAVPLQSEYPPLATAFFSSVSVLEHGLSFSQAWIAVVLFLLLFCTAIAAWAWGMKTAFVLLLSLFLTMLLSHPQLIFGRYDIVVGALLALAYLGVRKNAPALSGATLVTAGLLKIVPFALLPFFLIAAPNRKRFSISMMLTALAGLFLPFFLLGSAQTMSNIAYLRHYHHSRGVQIESAWSGVHMLYRALIESRRSPVIFHAGSFENMAVPDAAKVLSPLLAFAGLIVIFLLFLRSRRRSFMDDDVAPWLLSSLFWLLAVSTVLSPQYFVWAYPLAILWLFDRQQKAEPYLLAASLLLATAFLTQWIYPWHYDEFLKQRNVWLTIGLNVRNGLLLLMVFVLLCIDKVNRRKIQ